MRGTPLLYGLALAVGIPWTDSSMPESRAATHDGPEPYHRDVIVAGVSPDRARTIRSHAETVRRDIHAMLHGSGEPPRWVPPCTIHVHRDRGSFTRTVLGAPSTAVGATSIEFAGRIVRLRRIDVVDSEEDAIPGAIAHELVHAVLADHFTEQPPPRWADEGLATLFDTAAKQRGHDADFRAAAAQGQAWPLTDLMAIDLEPNDAARQRVFYGQSASLVRWMLSKKDGPTFLRFLDDESGGRPDEAVRAHYGMESVAALERAWTQETPAR